MSIEIDHAKRRMTMKAEPGFSGAALSRRVAECIRNDHRVASYDFVMDVRESDTGSTLDDFRIVLAVYHAVEREPGLKFGCYVSTNASYQFWAKAMADMFGDRSCPVFMTAEKAQAFLDAERGLVAAETSA